MSALTLPLNNSDLDRLGKFLGMLGSDHAGERAAAGLKADNLLRERGATWTALVESLKSGAGPTKPMPPRWRPAYALDRSNWREWVNYCRARPADLTAWEADFLPSLLRYSTLSDKQAARLFGIVAKVEPLGCGKWGAP